MSNFGFSGSINIFQSGLTFKGSWNANTNNPFLQSGIGVAGEYYIVSVPGTTNLDGVFDWQIGDWAIFEGASSMWQKIDNHDIVSYNTIQEEGVSLPPQSVLDFQGDGVTASNGFGKTIVNIPIQPSYSIIKDEGSSLTQRNTINFVGGGVTASDVGGVTQVNIPTQPAYTTIQDEGSNLTQRNILNFVGLGVTATDDGSVTKVTILEGLPATNYGLYAQTSNSVPVTATIVEGSLIGAGVGTLSVPANGFFVGASFRGDFGGLLSAKNNDRLRIRLKTLSGVLLADSGVQIMQTASNDVFQLSINFTIRTTGVSGVASIVSLGVFHTTKQSNNSQTGFAFNTINNTTFDTTIPNTLVVTAQFSSNSALNSIYSDIFVLNKIY